MKIIKMRALEDNFLYFIPVSKITSIFLKNFIPMPLGADRAII